jgi:hypothetical protein
VARDGQRAASVEKDRRRCTTELAGARVVTGGEFHRLSGRARVDAAPTETGWDRSGRGQSRAAGTLAQHFLVPTLGSLHLA